MKHEVFIQCVSYPLGRADKTGETFLLFSDTPHQHRAKGDGNKIVAHQNCIMKRSAQSLWVEVTMRPEARLIKKELIVFCVQSGKSV